MRPGRLLLWLLGAWVVVGIAVSVWPLLQPVWWGSLVVLVLVSAWQWFRLSRVPAPDVRRHVMGSLPLGVWRQVRLELHNPGNRDLLVEVFDHHPSGVEQQGLPRTVMLAGGAALELTYRLRAVQRGDQAFGKVQLRFRPGRSLWVRTALAGREVIVRVYPNFAPVMRYALLAADDMAHSMGIRRRRRRGTGLEFHQLREYREGDLLRQVDWKATSRRRQLISREYQEERDQQVVFLLDCGRRMRSRDGDLSHFDHTLNALLLLTYVALRQGDSVGFLTFSGDERWLPPVKGPAGLTTVLNHVYGIRTSTRPSDYQEAATRLMTLLPRRALVVLTTNVREEDQHELQPALKLMHRRHLVLLASLRETVVEQVAAETVSDLRGALRFAAAHHYLADRADAHRDIDARGAMILDVAPRDLPAAMVNRYLDIKRAGIL